MFSEYFKDTDGVFEQYVSRFPKKRDEIIAVRDSLLHKEAEFFMCLYTKMTAADIISVNPQKAAKHAVRMLDIYENMPYCRDIPLDVYLDFALPYRVNDESPFLDGEFFTDILKDEVKDKTLEEAIKCVNYRCLSFATYAPADDRTKNALAVYKTGLGRCGEESVLLVTALRSVGIPARQVYSPYWVHCDDNHAWVEAFDGEKWRYLGACEPEDVLDTGWFDYASSKSAIVRYRKFGFGDREATAVQNRIYETVAVTGRYADVKKVTVHTEPFTKVGVYTINYGAPALIDEKRSDRDGKAVFETGKCGLLYFASLESGSAVSLCGAEDTEVFLDSMENLRFFSYDLPVDKGRVPEKRREKTQDEIKSFEYFDAERRTRLEKSESASIFGKKAGENYPELEKFMANTEIDDRQKKAVLDTLTLKDFSDVTAETLADMVLAFEYEDNLPKHIFEKYLLPQRVKNEPLYPFRAFVKDNYRGKIGAREIYAYALAYPVRFSSECYGGNLENLTDMMRYKAGCEESVDINFVKMCRALGIAAKLDEETGAPCYYDGAGFVPVFESDEKNAALSIVNKGAAKGIFGLNISLCRIDDEKGLVPMSISGEVEKHRKLMIPEGFYALFESRRQLDGSQNGYITFFWCGSGHVEEVVLTDIKDKTREMLKNYPMPEGMSKGGREIVAYIEPGEEPTEHLLSELIENAEKLTGTAVTLRYGGKNAEKGLLQRALSLKNVTAEAGAFDDKWEDIRKGTGVGDLRLPYTAAALNGEALFAFSGYHVGSVLSLIKILDTAGEKI